jgi:glutathione S-transferase
MTMITLYQQHDSGNCYKVRLVLTHLDRPFRTVAVSSFDGSTRRPDFLAKNPIGKVPAVQLGDGRFLAESNAILLYFGEGTALFPDDAYDRAKAYEWLFFEQYSHEPAIAVRCGARSASTPSAAPTRPPNAWRISWRPATGRWRSWSGGSAMPIGLPAMHSRSPTSRSMPTPTWRLTADMIWSAFRDSAGG